MLDLHDIANTNPLYRPAWTAATRVIARGIFGLPGRTEIVLEGLEHIVGAPPMIVSANHTHKFDFLPIRYALDRRGIDLVTWVKARDYRDRALALYLSRMGNIPLASRGYIIAADFARELGRAPTNAEYRRLRDHVDAGVDVEASFVASLRRSRSILGTTANPSVLGYAAAIRRAYHEMMQATVDRARVARDAGRHLQIYPQGATSGQLTPGRIGAVQAAVALELPIVPVGISGCREVFRGETPFCRTGRITIRFGEPMRVPVERLPDDFRPFHPDDEDAHREVLEASTWTLMDRIASLCDPQYRWAPDRKSDAKVGVARFFV